nr:MAG TPA: hypothetical protein [Caudoviricetes sp.]
MNSQKTQFIRDYYKSLKTLKIFTKSPKKGLIIYEFRSQETSAIKRAFKLYNKDRY